MLEFTMVVGLLLIGIVLVLAVGSAGRRRW